jgi:hypothetical protein
MRKPPSPPEPSIIRSTLRAEPRRLIPIVLLSASLVVAQEAQRGPVRDPAGIAMCVAFVIVAPVSWRVLFPTASATAASG